MRDEKLIGRVREHGTFLDNCQGREKVLKKIGFPSSQVAALINSHSHIFDAFNPARSKGSKGIGKR